jgi:hypothetical protein
MNFRFTLFAVAGPLLVMVAVYVAWPPRAAWVVPPNAEITRSGMDGGGGGALTVVLTVAVLLVSERSIIVFDGSTVAVAVIVPFVEGACTDNVMVAQSSIARLPFVHVMVP